MVNTALRQSQPPSHKLMMPILINRDKNIYNKNIIKNGWERNKKKYLRCYHNFPAHKQLQNKQ